MQSHHRRRLHRRKFSLISRETLKLLSHPVNIITEKERDAAANQITATDATVM